jgi:hypothetical protein
MAMAMVMAMVMVLAIVISVLIQVGWLRQRQHQSFDTLRAFYQL